MRKLLINNFFALTIAALVCTAIRTIVWVNDLMSCSDLFVTALLGIVAVRLFKSGKDLIDKRFNGLFVADVIMSAASIAGMAITLYSNYRISNLGTLFGVAFTLISKAARVFIYIYSAKLMMEFVSSDEQKGSKKGWTVQLVISIACWSINLVASVLVQLFVYRTEEIARRFEVVSGLVSLGVYMAMLIHLIFLLDRTSKTVVEKVVGGPSVYVVEEEAEEPCAYGFMSRAITVTVAVVLVFLLQSVARYSLINSAVSNIEKQMSHKKTTAINPNDSVLDILGYMPADDWTTVTSLEEIKEIQASDSFKAFVIEVDKNNIQPISDNEYKVATEVHMVNVVSFMYGKGSLLRSNIWGITDYIITFEDGSYVFATYPTRMINKLEDGVVKLPIAYTYDTEALEKVMDIELENRHVTPMQLRKAWMKETPVCGSFMDKLMFADILFRNAGIYMLVLVALSLAAAIAAARFLVKDITD